MATVKERRRREFFRNRNTETPAGASTESAARTRLGSETGSHDPGESVYVAAGPLSWDELVFEGRNQEYGAFVLRQNYASNILIGIGITLVVAMLVLSWPTLAAWFQGNENTAVSPPRKLVYSELSLPPPIDKPRPLPPHIQLPRLKKVLKFVPPKVVKEQVSELPPTIQEVKENEVAAVAVEGPVDIAFEEPVAEVVAEDDEIFTVVDQQPEFDGGYEAMMAFIKANLIYPPNARRMEIEGTVHVSFVVSKTGSISDVQVLRGIMTECDREAVRVVQKMPAWKPGRQNGRPVNVRFILPLRFRLN